jgi:hypothetical protein
MFPWIGMVWPFLLTMAFASLALPGVWEGHPAPWLTPPVAMAILIALPLVVFGLLYRLALDRIIDHTGHRRRIWIVTLVLWTVAGNALAILFEPRLLR